MSIKLLKQIALASTLALATLSAHASTYTYEDTSPPGDINHNIPHNYMSYYSTSWNEGSETLSINSTWTNDSSPITKISFLISDGGSPWVTGDHDYSTPKNEQFLWYDVDLATSVVSVTNYFTGAGHSAKTQNLQTFNGAGVVDITSTSLSLTLDHSVLNALSFAGMTYNGAGFTNNIGIWYYMYSADGTLQETYDVHSAGTSAVPVPAALFLFAPALAGFATMRRKLITAS